MTLKNGVVAWGMSPSKYVREAAKNCAKHVKDNFPGKYTLPASTGNTFIMGYEYVMNTSKALDTAQESYYQSIIGLMGCVVEIGSIDIET